MKRTMTFLIVSIFLLTGISFSQGGKDNGSRSGSVEELVGVYHIIYDGETIQFCDRLSGGQFDADKCFSLKLSTVGKIEFYNAEVNIIDADLVQLKQLRYISGQEALVYFRVVGGDSVSLVKIYLKSSDDIFVKDAKFSYENKKMTINNQPVATVRVVGETDYAIDEKLYPFLNGRIVTGIIYPSTNRALIYFFAPRIIKKKINIE